MSVFGEPRSFFDEMTFHKIANPLWICVLWRAIIGSVCWDMFTFISFDFHDCIRESRNFSLSNVRERIFLAGIVDVATMPVTRVTTGTVFVESIFPYQCDIMIQIDSNRIVTGNLECRTSIRYAENLHQSNFHRGEIPGERLFSRIIDWTSLMGS